MTRDRAGERDDGRGQEGNRLENVSRLEPRIVFFLFAFTGYVLLSIFYAKYVLLFRNNW